MLTYKTVPIFRKRKICGKRKKRSILLKRIFQRLLQVNVVKRAERRDDVGDLLRKRLSKQTITSRSGVGGQARPG